MSKMSNTFAARLRRLFRSRPQVAPGLYDELIYLSGRTQSLDELLTLLPERITGALELSSFHIVLHEKREYVLQDHGAVRSPLPALPASCSTVARMKRDRKPALFIPEDSKGAERDGWQLLAEPYELEFLRALDAQVLLPLEGRTGLMGFATLSRGAGPAFSDAELRFLGRIGPEIGRGLETAQLVTSISRQAVERARAHRALEVAREVQERLLPEKLPRVPGLDAAAAYRSAEQIGGDYYDIFPIAGGSFCAVIADVSGKGVPAALLMSALRASIHALALEGMSSAPMLAERLNTLLYKASASARYATMFLCVYEPESRSLTYVNAGHNPPLLLRTDGLILRLDRGGLVTGLLPDATYEAGVIELSPGDLLTAFTDGVSEATNRKGEEWGEESIAAALLELREAPNLTAGEVVRAILRKLDAFTANAAQTDDITLLVLRGSEEAAEG